MWKRFTRALKSLFGGAIGAMEDPKLILEQNIRELNDHVPRMNENIATIKASKTLLEKQMEKYQNEHRELEAKIKTALEMGKEEIAENFAMRYQTVKGSIQDTRNELETVQIAYDKALEIKKAFMREREKKIEEARDAIAEHERSKLQAQIADTLEQFEVGGIDQTHDEMVGKINERSAKNEARMEVAMNSIDTEQMKFNEEAEKMQARMALDQFKQEMAGDSQSQTEENSGQADTQRQGGSQTL